ncbi:hypothetical protein [Novipirellula caenicola]|uniref:hypothetical protein n=1 Tax=Novipirellula caenicola TaxID=1536901 RepID=UPI0031EE47AF
MDHEFSGVPFYLDRNDIQNFLDFHDHGLSDFVTANRSAVLIVDHRIAPEELRKQLPEETSLTEIGHRASACIYRAKVSPQVPKIANAASASSNQLTPQRNRQ